MLAITLLGSIFYILFKILEKFLNNSLTSNIYYKLSKIIALAFIVPISYILSLYLPDFTSINFNNFYKQNEPIKQTITENKIPTNNNNNFNNIVSENTITKTNTLNENININNEKEIDTNIGNTKININYSLILKIIYILGLILFIFINLIFFIKFKTTINKSNIILDKNYNNILNKVKQNLNINKTILIFENECVFSPMLVGILTPKIILPKKDIHLQDLEFILAHELIHFKRKDLLTKFILLLINIINYFNPLIYLLIKDIDKWCEYSCDEKLIKIYNNKKSYCLAILNGLNPNKKSNIYFSTTFACNKSNLKRRLENIMSENKLKNKLKITLICSFFTFACAIFILAFSIFYSNNKVDALAKENNKIERTFDEPIYLDSGNKPIINYEEVHMTTEILPEEKERQLIPKVLLKGTFKKEEPSTGPMELDFITRRFNNDIIYSTDKYIKIDLENIEQLSYDPKNILNLNCRIIGKYIDKFTGEIKEVYLGKFAVPKSEKRTFVFEAIPDIYAYKLKFQHPNSYAPSFNLKVTAGYTLESLGVDSISTTTFEENIPLIYSDFERLNNYHKDPNYNGINRGNNGTRTYKLQLGFYNNLNLKLENKSNDEYTLFVYDKSVDIFKEEYIGSPSTLYKEYTIQPNSTLDENFTNTLVKEYEVHLVPTSLKGTYLELHNFRQKVYDTYEENGKEDKKANKLYEEFKNKEKEYCIEYEKYMANQKGSIYYKFTK